MSRASAGPPDRRVGLTTTVPVEVLLAGGWEPVDLNNAFICHPHRSELLREGEQAGLPRTACSWNRGVLAVALRLGLRRVVHLSRGDCSTAEAVVGLLQAAGVETVPFAYPTAADGAGGWARAVARLARRFGTDRPATLRVWDGLRPLRRQLEELDGMTWDGGRVTGWENHLWLVGASDFRGDPERYRADLDAFLAQAARRPAAEGAVRLGVVGVPPIFDDLHTGVEVSGGRVVFNEMARQFAMVPPADSLAAQLAAYTYPGPLARRLADITAEIARRRLDGLIHFVQGFCFHQLEDAALRRAVGVPVLTVEGDEPGCLSARDRVRLEAFLSRLAPRRSVPRPAGPAVGIDLGSRWVKVVVRAGERVRLRRRFDTIAFYRAHTRRGPDGLHLAEEALGALLEEAGLDPQAAGRRVSATGYGRHLARFDGAATVPELEAHVAGVRAALGLTDFTLLDIGGQDSKVVRVRGGRIADFAMNDRCAAGGGRFLENMARALGVEVSELAAHHQDPVPMSATCATFGESEVVGLIVAGVPAAAICAGVNRAVYLRVRPDLARLASDTLVLVGGVARGPAIRAFVEADGLFGEVLVPPHPQFNGALGATHVG